MLRFGAFLMIFVHHSFPNVKAGLAGSSLRTFKLRSALGVPLFFFLSAYLICELLTREKEASGTVRLRDFYVRRILRIWPLYFGALGVSVLISLFSSPTGIGHVTVEGIAAYTFLRGNWWFGTGHDLHYFGVLWSISIEEQFYLLLPLFMRSVSRKLVAYGAIAVWIVAQVFTWHAAQTWGMDITYLRTNSVVAFQYFALGILMCLGLRHGLPQITKSKRVILGIAGICLFYLGEGIFHVLALLGRQNPTHVILEFCLNAIGIVFVFTAVLGTKVNATTNFLAYLGRLSYGLYVFHYAIMYTVRQLAAHVGVHSYLVLLDWGLSLPLTILAAQLSYRYYEKPFLILKERFTVIKSRTA